MNAVVATVANLKGGVGKSTTTVMLADGLAYFYGMNVLTIDLDAQANSSQMLLTERGVQGAYHHGKGSGHLLRQFMEGEPAEAAPFIVPNAVTLEELRIGAQRDRREGWIELLPSHPQMRLQELDLEEEWYSRSGTPTQLAGSLQTHFRNAFANLRAHYDIILVDCPPHLSPLARAGLAVSDVFVTPTIADAVCTWGTKQFSQWVTANITSDLAERNFIVITRYRNNGYSRQVANDLETLYLSDRTFGPRIPESVHVLNAMDRAAPDSYNTFRGKYGGVKGDVRRLAHRFTEFITKRTGQQWLKIRD